MANNDFPSWPAWRYGPNEASQIFDREEDVPEGWVDHPRKLEEAAPKKESKKPEVKKKDEKKELKPAEKVEEPKKDQEPQDPKKEDGEGDGEPVKEGESEEKPLSLEEIKANLNTKQMGELWKMATELELAKDGKKPELVDRIAQKLFEASSNE